MPIGQQLTMEAISVIIADSQKPKDTDALLVVVERAKKQAT